MPGPGQVKGRNSMFAAMFNKKKKEQPPKMVVLNQKKRKRKRSAAASTSSTSFTLSTTKFTTNKKQKIGQTVTITKADHDRVLTALRTIDWSEAKNTSRRNVIRTEDRETLKTNQGKPYCQSFIFGQNMKDPNGKMSWWSTEYPNQYVVLQETATKYVPEFSYTHITLNRNLRCKRHRDKGNLGPSFIAGFGPFKGGALIVEREGGGGEREFDVRSKLVSFNGATQAHETKPYTGERFTVVYYTSTIKPASHARGAAEDTVQPSKNISNRFQQMKSKLANKKKR